MPATAGTCQAFKLGFHTGQAPAIDAASSWSEIASCKLWKRFLSQIVTPTNRAEHSWVAWVESARHSLALAYVQRHRGAYDSVFWLNAFSETTLVASFRSIAARLLEEEQYELLEDEQILLRVRRWFSQDGNSRWLMIFDNYDEPKLFDIQKYYPYTTLGHIIITRRMPDQVAGAKVPVRFLEQVDDSLRVLETRSGRVNLRTGKLEQARFVKTS